MDEYGTATLELMEHDMFEAEGLDGEVLNMLVEIDFDLHAAGLLDAE